MPRAERRGQCTWRGATVKGSVKALHGSERLQQTHDPQKHAMHVNIHSSLHPCTVCI